MRARALVEIVDARVRHCDTVGVTELGALRDEDTTRNVIYATKDVIPIVTFDRRAPRAYRSCTSRVASTTPDPTRGAIVARTRDRCIPGRSSVASSPGVRTIQRPRSESENSSLRNLSIAPIENSTRLTNRPSRGWKTTCETRLRRVKTARWIVETQSKRFGTRSKPVRAHRRLEATVEKTTFRMSTTDVSRTASITRKTLPRPSRADFLPRVPTRAHVLIIFSRTARLVALLYA